MSVHKPILRRLLCSPFREAIVDDQRTWKSYQLYLGSLHLAKKIKQTTQATQVGVMVPTSGLFPLAALAGWMLGKVIVPLNYLLKGDDLRYVIDDAEIDTIITVSKMVEFVGGLPGDYKQILLEEVNFKGLPSFRIAETANDDDLAVLLYTSGTSGRPKGVMLSHCNLSSNVEQCVQWAAFDRGDIMLGVLPQFHSFGLTVLTLLPLTVGCKVIYTARFSPKKIITLLREHRPTALIAIPSMYNALQSAKSAKPEDFSSLRYSVSGGEPLPDAVFQSFQQRFNVTLNEGYGLTETGPVTHWSRPHERQHKSVGKPLPRVEQRIVDLDGNEVPVGEEGEIRLRGPNIMKGYYNLPEESAGSFDEDGYFRSGDMGRIDEQGNLFITGRIKEMLIIGGENVFPREIEEVLNAHESVYDSAVIGMEDPSRGEVPLAFVELEDGSTFDESALRSHCRDKLPAYKVPREIRQTAELPRNPTGKIMRRELRNKEPSSSE